MRHHQIVERERIQAAEIAGLYARYPAVIGDMMVSRFLRRGLDGKTVRRRAYLLLEEAARSSMGGRADGPHGGGHAPRL